jgi:hypothetical protein
MRFLMLMLPNIEPDSDWVPTADEVAIMSKYNEALAKAGVMLTGEGLHPQTEGHRIEFTGGKPTVIDGPFTETKEMIGGYWIIDVKSKDEALEWAKRVPAVGGDFTIELREIFEMEDFPEDVQAAAKF